MFEQALDRKIPQKYFVIVAIFALVNILLIIFFLSSFTTPFASDSEQYTQTARYFLGLPAQIFGQRMLKPLVPYLAAFCSYIFGDIGTSFIFINSVFYFFIGLVVFKIIKLLFGQDWPALAGSLLFLSAYPMLEYGIAPMTDLAGWFFFALSVYLTLLFLQKPGWQVVILNGLISSLGLLARESGGMGVLFFALCLLFIYQGVFWKKIKYLLGFGLLFLTPVLAWQIFVYLKFNYTYYDWLFVYNKQGQPAGQYLAEFFKILVKSLGATFLLGWILAAAGLAKIKKMGSDAKKIVLALVLPSFSFLLWLAASSRLFFMMGLLLAILASWGIMSLLEGKQKKVLYATILLGPIILGNYFWFIFDDRLRSILVDLFNIHY